MAIFTSNFILRTDKKNGKGEHPIVMTISVANELRKISTGLTVIPELWDKKNKLVKYISKSHAKERLSQVPYKDLPTQTEVNEMNDKLSSIRKLMADKARQFELENLPFDVDMLVARYNEAKRLHIAKTEKKPFLLPFIEEYIEINKSRVNHNTIKSYRTLVLHLRDFQREIGTAIQIKNVDYSLIELFENFLISKKNHLNVTATKEVSKLKAFITKARKKGLTINSTYQDYNVRKELMEVIALNETEFNAIKNLKLDIEGSVELEMKVKDEFKIRTISYKTLDRAKDIFVFACLTGLRYSDLCGLKPEHIKHGVLTIVVEKTRKPQTVPLVSAARAILDKYTGQLQPLPVISNQKLNIYIKQLGKLAGIDEPIAIKRWSGNKPIANTYPKYELMSVHTGRKTFVTLSLVKGMNSEIIMEITGHKSYSSFKRYLDVTDQQTKDAMLKAWET